MSHITCPLQHNAKQSPDLTAVICGNRELTYAQFHSSVCSTVNHLIDLNIQSEDRIGIKSASSLEALIVLYALWRLGAVSCLLNTRLPEETINQQSQELDLKLILEAAQIKTLVDAKQMDFENMLQDHAQFAEDKPLTILYTSGSMDQPKAAMHSFGNYYANAQASNEHIAVQSNDRWLLSLPLFHVGGLGILFRCLLGQGTIVIPEVGDDLQDCLNKYNLTHLSCVPTQLYRILKQSECLNPLKRLKALLLGGSGIPSKLIEQTITHQIPLYSTYGLTEMSSQVATTNRITNIDQAQHAKVLNGHSVKLGADRQLYVKGKSLFLGYIQNKNECRCPIDEQDYFATGDLGYIHEDETLMVFGRKDNMFISGGENIQPEEIESKLCGLERVEQAIVVAKHDPEFGHRPVAFLKRSTKDPLNQDELVDQLKEILPKYKIPVQFFEWPQMQKGSLKASRKSLQEIVNRQL